MSHQMAAGYGVPATDSAGSEQPTSTAAGNRPPGARLFAAEVLVLGFGILALITYAALGVPLRNPLSLWWVRIRHAAVLYSAGMLLALFFVRLADIHANRQGPRRVSRADSLARYRFQYLNRAAIVEDLRLLNAVAVMFTVFLHLKHLIPFLRKTMLDELLFEHERGLLGGRLAGEWLIDWLGVHSAPFWSGVYKSFYLYIAMCLIGIVLSRDRRFVRTFYAAFIATWFVGVLLVFALPTMGPCFSTPQLFANLPPTAVSDMQQKLLVHRDFVALHPFDSRGLYLISGLPSLHLAVPILISLFLGKKSRLVATASWLFCLLTAVATLYFGWHFVVDDVAACLLAVGIWKLAWVGSRIE
ncbi:MAG: phosphatase PAP2 family protein [Bdellovibrionales bacterium]|nr:phosphatase PAP2 family protein [Bdellovibrionales bacterium]